MNQPHPWLWQCTPGLPADLQPGVAAEPADRPSPAPGAAGKPATASEVPAGLNRLRVGR